MCVCVCVCVCVSLISTCAHFPSANKRISQEAIGGDQMDAVSLGDVAEGEGRGPEDGLKSSDLPSLNARVSPHQL